LKGNLLNLKLEATFYDSPFGPVWGLQPGLGALYTTSQGKTNLGQTLSIFVLQICWYPFFSLGANTRPQCSAFISNLGQIEKLVSMSALTLTVKPSGLISTFAPIGMLDLG
jgi:hypothetical protein